ncbi:putative E3 ubiquitin-protein ligase [Phlyctochytrium planicorne]|nr:putative E3 ubiquitin-protein ligase [Phlyctochytrium planicorne]
MALPAIPMTTGKCLCCDNLLRFPQTVTCFRCTVCETVNDLIPIMPPEKTFAEVLTLKRLKVLLDPSHIDENAEHIIRDAFCYHQTLNESFSVLSEGEFPTLENPGISLEDVREAYHLITASRPAVIAAMMFSIDKLLRRPGRLPLPIFQKKVDLVNHFITYRITNKERMRELYSTDWGIKSAARVMKLLFAANTLRVEKLAAFEFYNTVVDYIDLVKDFWKWQEERSGAFSFCQYPFLISLGSKIQIMESDAKKQQTERFKEAFYRTAIHQIATDPFLSIHVRRTALIEDSLNQLQSRHIDLKKKLRIEFVQEDGVDAGGLTKEWFLLLVRDLFDPSYGMFSFDEDSNLCWFNPASFENNEEYRLVGIIMGLAVYNNTILDVHFPLACYKKLLGRPVGLEDLKALKPGLGRGLQSLLDYDGDDVEAVFCRDFVAEYEAFGDIVRVPLIPNGESTPVTSKNKKEYVDRLVSWILNESVSKQFDAFRDGFYHVCGGNALSLFGPDEMEMMVRGGTELDIRGLESMTEYEGFHPDEPTIRMFWEIVHGYTSEMKGKLLLFVTGTDRIPATQNMAFKITCLGEDSDKLPISHTCFNQLCIPRYRTREKLEAKLSKAIAWSSGFHVK